MMFTTAADLENAVANAKGGETFMLGDIAGPVRISRRSFVDPITLKGGSVSLIPSPSLVDYQPLIWIDGCEGIMIDGVRVTGVGSDGAQMGWGVRCAASKRISMTRCTFSNLKIAAMLNDVSTISLAHNDVALCREGFDIVMAEDVLVSRNWMRDFDCGEGDHVDAIQFWTRNATRGCARVTISENLFHFARATPGQGINGGDADLGYDGFIIEDNLIINSMWHAITFDAFATNLKISRNRVYNTPGAPAVPGGPITPWIRAASSAELSGNMAPRYVINGPSDKVSYDAPADNSIGGDVSAADAEAIAAKWIARMRPEVGAQPTPSPEPVPVPAPAPIPTPIDTAQLRAKLVKAATEVNTAVNDLRRAKTAVDAAGKALDALEEAIAGQ